MSDSLPSSPEGIQNVHSRVRVKVCGITSLKDAEAAVAAGVDALGFNTWTGSKRYLDLAEAWTWIARLPGFVTRVALCINAPLSRMVEVADLPYIDSLQVHGDESKEDCAGIAASGRSLIRAVRLGGVADLEGLDGWSTPQILVDASVPGAYGGTGAMVNLELAREAVRRFPNLNIILAGGLEPNNVGELVRQIRPYAVDVASGVESAPGKKDWAKMRDFVQAVRCA